jgi:preprotein translocase subunit SecA
MTGTAKSAAAEFYEIYGLRMVPIPTNKPPRRKDLPLRLYYTEKVRPATSLHELAGHHLQPAAVQLVP